MIKSQVLALLLLLAWLATLLAGLEQVSMKQHWLVLVLFVLLRTYLQTGLFIVAHDAMHRLLVPGNAALNDRIGALLLALYAALPFDRCLQNHRRHHRSPGCTKDPDFHHPVRAGVLPWYCQFMGRYLSIPQMTVLITAWGLLAMTTSMSAVLLICTLPLLLSSLQLFVVGTYLPHRHTGLTPARQEAVSLPMPEWLSLLACFHFGYHLEHHQSPNLAWHQLPRQWRQNLSVSLATAGSAQ